MENGANLSSVLWNKLYFTTIIKRLFVTGNIYTLKVKIIYAKNNILNVCNKYVNFIVRKKRSC